MTYPENLQDIVDEAFIAVNKKSLFCTPMGNLWSCEAQQRLDIAKRILSAVGFTEPKPKSELEIIKEEVKNLVQRIKKLEYGGEA